MMYVTKLYISSIFVCALVALHPSLANGATDAATNDVRILCVARCMAKCLHVEAVTVIDTCRSMCGEYAHNCKDKSCWQTCKDLGTQTAGPPQPPSELKATYADNYDVDVSWKGAGGDASGAVAYLVQYRSPDFGRWHMGGETISHGAKLLGLKVPAEKLCKGLELRVASATFDGGISEFSSSAFLEPIRPIVSAKPELKSLELIKEPYNVSGYYSNATVIVTLGYNVQKWIFSHSDIGDVQVLFPSQNCNVANLAEAIPESEAYSGTLPQTMVVKLGADVMYRNCWYIVMYEQVRSKRCNRAYELKSNLATDSISVLINCNTVKNCEMTNSHKAPRCGQVDEFKAEVIDERDVNWYDQSAPISVNVTFRHTPRRGLKPQSPLYFVARYGDAAEYNTSDEKAFVGVRMINELGNATNCLEFSEDGSCKEFLPAVNASELIYSIVIANLSMDKLYGVMICAVVDAKNVTLPPINLQRMDRVEIRAIDHRVSRRDFWLATCGAAVAGILVVLIVGFFVWSRRQRAIIKRKKLSLAAMQKETEKRYVDFPRREDIWELERRNLIIYDDRKLGSGAFGAVYLGRLIGAAKGSKDAQSTLGVNLMRANNCEVAVKMLPEYADELSKSEFLREIALMKTLGYHERLVNMLACVTNSEPYCLVVEYCRDGDLLHFLKERCAYMLELEEKQIDYSSYDSTDEFDSDMIVTVKELLQFTVQISYGLEYLSQKGFVHRDVAARNVLVHDKHYVKIGDFGLCRFIYADSANYKSKGGRLPVKWMSPEAIRHYEFTTKSDVWSFGILMFEIITLGGTPYPGIQPDDMLSFLESGNRIAKPDNCPDQFYDVMSSCWAVKPDDRPEFSSIRRLLAIHLEGITDEYSYLKLDAQKDYYNVAYTEKREQAGNLSTASEAGGDHLETSPE